MEGLTVEERLDKLEGARVNLRAFVRELYADYQSARRTLAEAEEEVIRARKTESAYARAVIDARNAYNEEEIAMLATDERAAGKNPDDRKRNAGNLIAAERKADGRLYNLWTALYTAEVALELAQAEKECAIDAFSAIKHVCHMISGMGRAIGA